MFAAIGGAPLKRQISDMLDQSVLVHSGCFVITADNRFMVSCGYWDRSFRITVLESGTSLPFSLLVVFPEAINLIYSYICFQLNFIRWSSVTGTW